VVVQQVMRPAPALGFAEDVTPNGGDVRVLGFESQEKHCPPDFVLASWDVEEDGFMSLWPMG
jgi:hypothetical protein